MTIVLLLHFAVGSEFVVILMSKATEAGVPQRYVKMSDVVTC
jgi:hypothetical protein